MPRQAEMWICAFVVPPIPGVQPSFSVSNSISWSLSTLPSSPSAATTSGSQTRTPRVQNQSSCRTPSLLTPGADACRRSRQIARLPIIAARYRGGEQRLRRVSMATRPNMRIQVATDDHRQSLSISVERVEQCAHLRRAANAIRAVLQMHRTCDETRVSPMPNVAATAIRLPMRRCRPAGAAYQSATSSSRMTTGEPIGYARDDAVAVVAFTVVAAVAWETRRAAPSAPVRETPVRSSIPGQAARRRVRSCAPGRCATRQRPSRSATPRSTLMALQDARGFFRIQAALQVPRGDAYRVSAASHVAWLLQLDLMECRDRRVRFGVRLACRRQVRKPRRVPMRHRRQPIDRFAPDDDCAHG